MNKSDLKALALAAAWLFAFYFVAHWGTNNPELKQPAGRYTESVLPYNPTPTHARI